MTSKHFRPPAEKISKIVKFSTPAAAGFPQASLCYKGAHNKISDWQQFPRWLAENWFWKFDNKSLTCQYEPAAGDFFKGLGVFYVGNTLLNALQKRDFLVKRPIEINAETAKRLVTWLLYTLAIVQNMYQIIAPIVTKISNVQWSINSSGTSAGWRSTA